MTSESDPNQPDSDGLGSDLPTLPPDATGLDATVAAGSTQAGKPTVSTSTKLPDLDGYELQEELGRGGMGVVYRALDKKLDRPVAIKMILAGQFASPESVQRFQLEAETAARLDHRGIVPIYEIGQAGDHRFFSMKLIDGEPLSAALEKYQPDQRASVELMIRIAEAVQHAHQRGVLHRDLKPANVLIDKDGNPLLTDLGLAKQLDNDSAITQTGLVLGSPGFMSPEQAAGQTDVTVAADVYAMGAMLYWLVSGRAPITGKSAFEIVQRTIENEPDSMRDVRPDADRDLNLICMKALHKSPEQRYGSAEEFAAELQAWLEGEPLSVKPPTAITWMRRWVRNNFRGVAVGVSMGGLCGLLLGFIILMQIAKGQLDMASSMHEQLEAADPSWVIRSFAWLEKIPAAFRANFTSWITLITAICGLGTIGLSKPKRQESGVAAGLSAALLAGILAFVISWAWAPIANSTQRASAQDLELLSDYLFIHPDDRHLAEEVMFARYPGLPKADSWKRGELLATKIYSDQASSIPVAIWLGLVVTAFLSAIPLFLSSILSSVIWQREHRGWAFFWRSLEISFYGTTLAFLLCRSISDFTGAPPGPEFQLISSVAILAAIYAALRRKALWVRFPMFLAVFVTFGMNMTDTSKVNDANWRANRLVNDDAKIREIAPYFERLVDHTNDRYQQFQLAVLYAYVGDDAKYVEQCQELLADGNFYRRRVAEQASKVLLLKPQLHEDLSRAHQLARWASEQKAYNAWDYLARAISEQRQGNAAEALSWSLKTRETAASQSMWQKESAIATSYLVDALAYQITDEQDKSEAARQQGLEAFDPNSEASFEAKLFFKMLLAELPTAND